MLLLLRKERKWYNQNLLTHCTSLKNHKTMMIAKTLIKRECVHEIEEISSTPSHFRFWLRKECYKEISFSLNEARKCFFFLHLQPTKFPLLLMEKEKKSPFLYLLSLILSLVIFTIHTTISMRMNIRKYWYLMRRARIFSHVNYGISKWFQIVALSFCR